MNWLMGLAIALPIVVVAAYLVLGEVWKFCFCGIGIG